MQNGSGLANNIPQSLEGGGDRSDSVQMFIFLAEVVTAPAVWLLHG